MSPREVCLAASARPRVRRAIGGGTR